MVKNVYKLEKLKIKAYSKSERITQTTEPFEVMFNPESYCMNHEVSYKTDQGINTSGASAKYSLTKPRELFLKLIFDDTGIVSHGSKLNNRIISTSLSDKHLREKSVYPLVDFFLKQTVRIEGGEEEPKYLKIEWGDLNFDCRLESVKIHYRLFNRDGQPIRAELDTVFIEDKSNIKQVVEENKKSPDLTHTRTIKGGDKLPLMAQEVYGDSADYIKLARANNLNNLRKLNPGKTINLPPIKK